LKVNKVSANREKAEFMVIGHQRRINEFNDLPPLGLNDSKVKRVGEVKSKGVIVIIDEGLQRKNQLKKIDEVCHL